MFDMNLHPAVTGNYYMKCTYERWLRVKSCEPNEKQKIVCISGESSLTQHQNVLHDNSTAQEKLASDLFSILKHKMKPLKVMHSCDVRVRVLRMYEKYDTLT